MPSIRQSIRSSTASKRPTSAIADGQIALNTASGTPGIFFKDNANNIIKAGPAHYGATAPNSSPAVGGSTGNSIGEAWLDSSLTPAGWKIWNGSAWVNATPLSSDTVQGLVELATDAETQAGVDAARAVTAASLQSKVSDSISTTSASGIASSTAVKTAYDLANAALPKSGGIITGNLEIGSTGSFTFEGSSADAFETTLAVTNPTADRTITFPNVTGTVITTGDTGTVTGTMIADGTIVNAEISNTAAIAFSKLASLSSANIIVGNASGVPSGVAMTGDVTITNAGVTAIASNVIVNADINSAAAIAYSKLALSSGITNTDVSASAAIVYSKLALSNSIVNADIGTSAAIAGTKISPNFGSQNIQTSGTTIAGLGIFGLGSAAAPSITFSGDTNTGLYSPGADTLAFVEGGVEAMRIDSSGRVGIGTSSPGYLFTVSGGATSLASNQYLRFGAGLFASSDGSVDNYLFTGSGGLTVRNNTDVSSLLKITNAGLVGIGTSAPGVKLEAVDSIAGGSGGTIATLHNFSDTGGDTRYAGLNFRIGSDNGTSAIRAFRTLTATDYRTDLSFWTNPAGATQTPVRAMTIDYLQQVGIGTTAPLTKLEVRSGVITAGSVDAPNGAEILRGYYSSGALTVIGSEYSSGGPVIGCGVKPSTSASSAFLSSTSLAVARGAYTIEGNIHKWYIGAAQTVAENSAVVTSEAMRIDSSGRLLVGTSSAFDTTGDALIQAATSNGAFACLGNSDTSVIANENLGLLRFFSRGGSVWEEGARIEAEADLDHASGDKPGRLVFSTTADGASSPTERMRISQDGTVSYSPSVGANPKQILNASNNTVAISFRSASVERGNIFFLDSGVAYNTTSDYRLKENVAAVTDGISRLLQLKPSRFNFIVDSGKTVDGFLAHEAQSVVPECVTGEKDAVDEDGNPVYQGIDQSKLVPLLTAALQEAIAKIEALETRLSALEGN
jgi:hypothetical protein